MSMSRETTLQKPDEIAILVSTAGPRRLRINSFHYIMLYWIFLSFKHKYQTSNIQEQHLNHVSWGEPNSTFSLQKKHTQEITQRKRSKHSYSSSHCKRPMKYIHIYLYIYTPFTLLHISQLQSVQKPVSTRHPHLASRQELSSRVCYHCRTHGNRNSWRAPGHVKTTCPEGDGAEQPNSSD